MPKIMKLTDVGSDKTTVEEYIYNDEYVMEQKFDGTRIMMNWSSETDEIVWSNDGVKPVTHAAAKLKLPALEQEMRRLLKTAHFEGLIKGPEVSLDGELLIRTGEYLVWDILDSHFSSAVLETPDSRNWSERHRHLERFFLANDLDFPMITKTRTAWSTKAKRKMWERINDLGVEGAVSKHIYSVYKPGARTRQWVKHKLVKTADLVVMKTDRTFKPNGVVEKGSAVLGYYTEDSDVCHKLCSASLIGKDLTIEYGDVVEINYLYLEPGGSPVQPRIIVKRWDAATGTGDKKPEACDLNQFPAYSRMIVEVGF